MKMDRWYFDKRSIHLTRMAVGVCSTVLTATILTLTRSTPVYSSQGTGNLAATPLMSTNASVPFQTTAGQSATLLPDGRWLLIAKCA